MLELAMTPTGCDEIPPISLKHAQDFTDLHAFSVPLTRRATMGLIRCRLTVKLRGRTITPDKRRGRTLSPRARGAKPRAHHGPLERLLDGHRSRSAANLRNRKSAADLRSQPIRNLGVPGNCFNVTGLGIAPKRVRAPLALQIAAVMTQMPQQSTAFHSTVTVSRVTPLGRPRSASARRSRRIRAIAAARLFRAAAFVRPCPFAPGTSAQYATNHLPSRSIIAVNSFRMAPLYRAIALATVAV